MDHNHPINEVSRVQSLCRQLQTALQQFREIANGRIRNRLAQRILEIRAELFVLGYAPLETVAEPAMVSAR